MGFTLGEPPAIQRFIVTPSGFSFRSVAPLPSHAETTSPSAAPARTMGASMAPSHANDLSY